MRNNQFIDLYVQEIKKNRDTVVKVVLNQNVPLATIYRNNMLKLNNQNGAVEQGGYHINISYAEIDAIFDDNVQKFIVEECKKLLKEPNYLGCL